jgi:hypothetical protein
MASSILSALLAPSVTSFVDERTGVACWTDAKSATVEIMSSSENAENPLSNQQVSESSVSTSIQAADIKTSKIIKPVRVRITMYSTNVSLVENILTLFADITSTISLTSKSIIAKSLAIENVEIDQTPDMLSATKIILTLEQAQVNTAPSFNPSQSGDQNNYGVSVASPQSVGSSLTSISSSVGSLLSTASDAVSSLYNRVSSNLGI